MKDVVALELSRQAEDVADAEEVCNYVDALNYARNEIANPKGLPISARLTRQARASSMGLPNVHMKGLMERLCGIAYSLSCNIRARQRIAV